MGEFTTCYLYHGGYVAVCLSAATTERRGAARCLDWSARMCLVPDAKALKKISKIGVDDIAARTYPTADPEWLQLCADMLVWFFVTDDQYDERLLARARKKWGRICANFVRILETVIRDWPSRRSAGRCWISAAGGKDGPRRRGCVGSSAAWFVF